MNQEEGATSNAIDINEGNFYWGIKEKEEMKEEDKNNKDEVASEEDVLQDIEKPLILACGEESKRMKDILILS
jgi:hypothetical protein